MTTNPLSRLRKLVGGVVGTVTIEGVRKKHLEPLAAQVGSFEAIGGPAAAGGWIPADDHPALFDRDPEALERDLTELWQRHGRSALLPLAAPVAKLAKQARDQPLRSEREVSSTVYAMQ